MHFFTHIFLQEHIDESDIESILEIIMEPYNEDIEVDEYAVKCDCVGYKVVEENNNFRFNNENRVSEIIENMLDSMCTDEQKYVREFMSSEKYKEIGNLYFHSWDDEPWVDSCGNVHSLNKILSIIIDLRKEAINKELEEKYKIWEGHPDKDTPDPDCKICDGTGFRLTTYNPKSKWDWWRVGGRWSGEISNKPLRSEDGFNFDTKYEKISDNITTGRDLLKALESGANLYPYSFVTLDGEWIDKEEPGPHYMIIKRKSVEEWQSMYKNYLEKHPDSKIVGIDVHI